MMSDVEKLKIALQNGVPVHEALRAISKDRKERLHMTSDIEKLKVTIYDDILYQEILSVRNVIRVIKQGGASKESELMIEKGNAFLERIFQPLFESAEPDREGNRYACISSDGHCHGIDATLTKYGILMFGVFGDDCDMQSTPIEEPKPLHLSTQERTADMHTKRQLEYLNLICDCNRYNTDDYNFASKFITEHFAKEIACPQYEIDKNADFDTIWHEIEHCANIRIQAHDPRDNGLELEAVKDQIKACIRRINAYTAYPELFETFRQELNKELKKALRTRKQTGQNFYTALDNLFTRNPLFIECIYGNYDNRMYYASSTFIRNDITEAIKKYVEAITQFIVIPDDNRHYRNCRKYNYCERLVTGDCAPSSDRAKCAYDDIVSGRYTAYISFPTSSDMDKIWSIIRTEDDPANVVHTESENGVTFQHKSYPSNHIEYARTYHELANFSEIYLKHSKRATKRRYSMLISEIAEAFVTDRKHRGMSIERCLQQLETKLKLYTHAPCEIDRQKADDTIDAYTSDLNLLGIVDIADKKRMEKINNAVENLEHMLAIIEKLQALLLTSDNQPLLEWLLAKKTISKEQFDARIAELT